MAAIFTHSCVPQPGPSSRTVVRLVRDSTLSEPLVREYERTLSAVQVQLVDFVGSIATVNAIQRGEADFGFVLADVAYFAYREVEPRRSPSLAGLRGVAALQVTPVHLLIRRGLDIQGIANLRGMRVATGTEFSGMVRLADLLLRSYGLDLNSVRRGPLATESTIEALTAGTVDAAFTTGYYPSPLVSEALDHGARLMPIDGQQAERFRYEYPFVRNVRIPAGTYPDQSRPIRTLGVQRLLVCRDDLDDKVVHDLTRQLFDALPRLASSLQTSLRLMEMDQASATPIPLHRGAAQYYRERELAE